MSMRGEFCRVLDKYKSGKWDRDKSAAQLEKYTKLKLSEQKAALKKRLPAKIGSNSFFRDDALNEKHFARQEGYNAAIAKMEREFDI